MITASEYRSLRNLMAATCFVSAILIACVLFFGCRVPGPTTTIGKAIRCSAKSVQENWPRAIGPVNSCLANTNDIRACLIGLINPSIGITEDVIACLVKDQGAAFLNAAGNNPDDLRSGRAASRAEKYLTEMDYRFVE